VPLLHGGYINELFLITTNEVMIMELLFQILPGADLLSRQRSEPCESWAYQRQGKVSDPECFIS
jgi:hypothetical protein